VAVVGGGITGLTAARSLARRGAAVSLYEAGALLGGQIRTVTVAGHRVDVGAEALHLASPAVRALIDQLGVAGNVVTARPGRSWIWTGDRLRRLPAGVGPAGPTRRAPVLSARVLSPRGLARAAVEPLVPRTAAHRDGRDVAVGALVASRFGRQVADRLVDPLLGNLHAGDVSRLSVRATTPQLAAQAARHRSLLLARRPRGRGASPSFVSFTGGLTTLTEALLADVAVEVHLGAPVASITRTGHRYRVVLAAGPGSGGARDHDAVVLAVPFDAAADLLGPMALGAAARLTAMRSASVVTVVAAYPRGVADATPALAASGVLVTSSAGRLLKAATFLTRKWPHLDDPDVFLVRLSAGRAGSTEVSGLSDDELVERLHADLADATGLAAGPTATLVTRWPRALAQLEVGHVERTEAIRHQLRGLPGLVLAGASYEGLGIAACIGSGERAAETVSAQLAGTDRPAVTG
jgi:oxygen-dependent protoporphyrinogen oxidase